MLTRRLNGMEQLERRDLWAAAVDWLPITDAPAADMMHDGISVPWQDGAVKDDISGSGTSAKTVEEACQAIANLRAAGAVTNGVHLGFDDSDAFIPAHATGVVEHRYATLAPYETSLEIELLAEMRNADGSDTDLWLHFEHPVSRRWRWGWRWTSAVSSNRSTAGISAPLSMQSPRVPGRSASAPAIAVPSAPSS